jgi:nickel-dependent lactate racemase
VAAMFGPGLRPDQLLRHEWRDGVRVVGVLRAAEVNAATNGRFSGDIEVAVDTQLFDGWDLIVSIGQVVPHEVIGMANFTKNLVIGLGGAPTIHRTHFVGAMCGMESIMGRATTAVRDLVDAAFDRFVAPTVDVLWVLTVVEDTGASTTLRGVFVGEGSTAASGGAAYRAAAALARAVNVEIVDEPFQRAVCWLDPREFHSTWLGNKAIYRTRMAMADDGELVVLAPGVRRFGEDDRIDTLIRRHGYRGTPAAVAAAEFDTELAANPSAIAHLIHGSSEGRFRIVYCTDPDHGGLTREEVESVGYEWRSLSAELAHLGRQQGWPTGTYDDAHGHPFVYIANPALGLWAVDDPKEGTREGS